MKKTIFLLFIMIFFTLNMEVFAQQGLSIDQDGTDPHPSAILDVKSTDKGVLFPRLTQSQRNAVNNPAEFLLIINTDNDCLEMFVDGEWKPILCP